MEKTKVKIVRLDGRYVSFQPSFTFPHEYIEYSITPTEDVSARIRDASVVIVTRNPLTASHIAAWAAASARPKVVAVMAIGVDMLDLAACREHGILVCNVPAASNESVAEHALALYFAARRKVTRMHEITVGTTRWMETGSGSKNFGTLPLTAKHQVMGIIGAGDLESGNRVAVIGRALGMTVMIGERKGAAREHSRPGRIPFPSLLQQCTVVMITCTLNATTASMIDEEELKLMRRDAVLINVARGGIVVEEALVKALREGWISGAATDVFVEEPAGPDNSALIRALQLDKELNLVLSPHVAWFAQSSIDRLQKVLVENVTAFVVGEPQNLIE